MKLPNFLIAGVSASGTSFLAESIRQHRTFTYHFQWNQSAIFFKSWEYKKGLKYYSKKWFKNSNNEYAIGERSSSYLFGGNKTAKKIFSNFPNIKLIFCIRNPIERAWANYRFTVLQGYENLPFIEALKKRKQELIVSRVNGKKFNT